MATIAEIAKMLDVSRTKVRATLDLPGNAPSDMELDDAHVNLVHDLLGLEDELNEEYPYNE